MTEADSGKPPSPTPELPTPDLAPTPSTPEVPVPELEFPAATPAVGGIRRVILSWRMGRIDRQLSELREDKRFHQHAVTGSLEKKVPKPAYNPLDTFGAKHRVRRAGFGEVRKPIDYSLPQARTKRQERYAVRQNLRINRLNKNDRILYNYDTLYDDFDLPERADRIAEGRSGSRTSAWGEKRAMKQELRQEMDRRHIAGRPRKGIEKGGKKVLKAHRSTLRVQNRLDRSVDGFDTSGRVRKYRIRHKTEKISRMPARQIRNQERIERVKSGTRAAARKVARETKEGATYIGRTAQVNAWALRQEAHYGAERVRARRASRKAAKTASHPTT